MSRVTQEKLQKLNKQVKDKEKIKEVNKVHVSINEKLRKINTDEILETIKIV